MDSKEAIMEAAMALVREKGDRLEEITLREISKKAGAGLGLINYHFGNKEHLIELCVERVINDIVERFRALQDETAALTPLEKLDALGNLTLTFLFEHDAISRISILSDLRAPRADDNTHRTYLAFLPLVAACRPDWDETEVRRHTLTLIFAMQQSFLRHEVILQSLGIDLTDAQARKAFHSRLLRDILGVSEG